MLKTTNYLEETKPLFRLLQTEAFRFVIVHYNHFDSVTRLKNDLKSRFPNRNARTINARKINYRQLLDAYYDTATGFFFVDNFEEIIKDPSIYAGLNQRRDKLAKYPIAFIAFIPHSQEQLYARQIMEKMPDLWSFRSLMLTLLQPLPQTNNEGFQGLESTRTSLGGKTDEEKQTELERLLQEIEANPNELALVQTLYAQVIDLQIDLRLYGEALLSLEKLEAFELTGEQQEEVWYNRGQVYKKQGRLAEAIVAFEKAAQIAKAHIEKQADYQNKIGGVYKIMGNYELALKHYHQALTIYQEVENREGEGAILNNISQIYKARGEYEKALELLGQSLKMRQEIGDQEGEGVTLNNISQVYKAHGEYEKALDLLQQSLKIRQKIGDQKGEGVALNNIGQIYQARGEYEKALDLLQQSLKIRQKTGDREGEVATLNNIGGIYRMRGEYEKVLELLEQSLKINQEIGNREVEGKILNNIGQIYDASGEYEKAMQLLEQSLKISQEIGNRAGEVITLHNMACIDYEQDRIEAFFEKELKAWQLANEIQNAHGILSVGHYLGAVLCMFKETELGLPILQQAYEIAQQNDLPQAEEIAALIKKYAKP